MAGDNVLVPLRRVIAGGEGRGTRDAREGEVGSVLAQKHLRTCQLPPLLPIAAQWVPSSPPLTRL